MAHSKEAHGKHAAMKQFNEGHWEKKKDDTSVADGRYCGEMAGAEELGAQVNKLASYAKKNRMSY